MAITFEKKYPAKENNNARLSSESQLGGETTNVKTLQGTKGETPASRGRGKEITLSPPKGHLQERWRDQEEGRRSGVRGPEWYTKTYNNTPPREELKSP